LATSVAPQVRTRRSITEVSGTPNAILKSALLRTGSDHRSDPERLGPLGCPPAPGSEYLPVFYQSQGTVHSCGDGDTLDTGGDDLSCSYTTEMDPGNISLGLETQTDLSRGDWNRYSSTVYSEGCLDKKGEVIVVDEVTVKVEGDAPPTWNVDETPSGEGHSQGRDFLDYRESLETNPNVTTHSPCPQNVEIHQRVHTGVKSFSCTQCHMRFAQAGDLKRHQRVHTGVKPFSCTQCHMSFAQAGNLKRHQRVHTGEKPYSCPQCEKRFSRQHQLKMHLKVHTGERPFACTHCSKSFSERSYLRIHQHQTVHTGEKSYRPFICTHCGKRFSERRYLSIHQQKKDMAHV
uniref:C2H2-type domain-containing protein n=1 Tax=Salmo trutta TaxID=8032 RepID=A0A674ARD2_SALTR